MNAGAEYIDTGNTSNQGEKIEYLVSVRQPEFRQIDLSICEKLWKFSHMQ